MSAPRVTIGVPVYNGERYLAAALDCCLAQTYPDFELIIVDNASTDGTEGIARAYLARDPRVRYERAPVNVGVVRNFRRALADCRTEYFRWAADDDLFAPTLLERCVAALDACPDVVMAYPRTRLIDANGHPIRDYDDRLHLTDARPSDRFIAVLRRLGLCNATYGLWRAATLRRARPFGTFHGSDVVLLAELSLHGKFHEVPEVLFLRRMHEEASSAMGEAELLRHYDPQAPQRVVLRSWRHLGEHLRAIANAPVSLREKARTAAWLLRESIRARGTLEHELAVALRAALRRQR